MFLFVSHLLHFICERDGGMDCKVVGREFFELETEVIVIVKQIKKGPYVFTGQFICMKLGRNAGSSRRGTKDGRVCFKCSGVSFEKGVVDSLFQEVFSFCCGGICVEGLD